MRPGPHPRGNPRSLLTRLALLLLLGAAINVLVAWACALWLPVATSNVLSQVDVEAPGTSGWALDRLRLDRLPSCWTLRPKDQATERLAYVQTSDGFGVRHVSIVMHEMFRRPYEQLRAAAVGNVFVVEAGLPFPSVQAVHERFDAALLASPLRERYVVRTADYATGQPVRWRGAIDLPAWVGARAVLAYPGSAPWSPLPYEIRPLGFLLNTLFWSAVIGVPGLLWSSVRRQLRLRRGLCLDCAYDLKDLRTCPECGQGATPARTPPPAP